MRGGVGSCLTGTRLKLVEQHIGVPNLNPPAWRSHSAGDRNAQEMPLAVRSMRWPNSQIRAPAPPSAGLRAATAGRVGCGLGIRAVRRGLDPRKTLWALALAHNVFQKAVITAGCA